MFCVLTKDNREGLYNTQIRQ